MRVCEICGIPADAGFFDESTIVDPPATPGQELVLASYKLHRNYCGLLLSFAQFTDKLVTSPPEYATPGLEWQIRCNGIPRDPYIRLTHIINPWGYGWMPVALRLEEGCTVELVVRNVAAPAATGLPAKVGGRIVGRFWYNVEFGGAG